MTVVLVVTSVLQRDEYHHRHHFVVLLIAGSVRKRSQTICLMCVCLVPNKPASLDKAQKHDPHPVIVPQNTHTHAHTAQKKRPLNRPNMASHSFSSVPKIKRQLPSSFRVTNGLIMQYKQRPYGSINSLSIFGARRRMRRLRVIDFTR